jgi:hypothetical protein
VIIVADINTVWRKLPVEALARFRPVLGLQPMDPWISLKAKKLPWGASLETKNGLATLSVTLPFSWATRRARDGMRSLWEEATKVCTRLGHEPSAVVATSPHYTELIGLLPETVRSFYYCSDDYLNYEGWPQHQMAEQERELLSRVQHSFFVSETLRQRAIGSYGTTPERTSVSKNATSPEFIEQVGDRAIEELLKKHPRLKRPIAGVIGSISDRLDLDLLHRVASIKEIGALALVGPVEAGKEKRRMEKLLQHPKVISVGHQARNIIPAWCQLLDVGVIPYRESRFNFYCSPLRLFDHLASGRPIVATSACPQVLEFAEYVTVAENHSDFVGGVRCAVTQAADPARMEAQRNVARRETWIERAVTLHEKIG